MSTTTPARLIPGIDETEYHAMPGLSATSMKWLLRSPKFYRQMVDHRAEKPEFDLGHAVHAKVLGVGLDVVVIPDDLLASNGAASTKAAKEFIEQARAGGMVPVKADVLTQVDAIAEAVLTHPKASALLALPGESEVSLFADDPDTGVPLRGRVDRLDRLPDGRVINVDLKTTSDVRDGFLGRAIEDHGYDIQSEAYRHLLRLNGLDPVPTHLIFVEVDPPHEVCVKQLAHEDGIDGGRRKMRLAIARYAQCIATGRWPGRDDTPGAADVWIPRAYYLSDIEAMEAGA